jgi:hypothetical protein
LDGSFAIEDGGGLRERQLVALDGNGVEHGTNAVGAAQEGAGAGVPSAPLPRSEEPLELAERCRGAH